MPPEKLHLALNHLVFLFPLAALIPLIFGFITRSRTAMISGFLIALTGSLANGLVMDTGEKAYKRYKADPGAFYLDAGAVDALERHEAIGHTWAKIIYVLAGVSAISLIIAWARRRWIRKAVLAVAILCVISATAGVYIANSGSEIHRPDFRAESP